MKGKAKPHILCQLQLYIRPNADTKAKIPQKTNKIAHIFVRDIRGTDLTNPETTQSVLKTPHETLGIDSKPHPHPTLGSRFPIQASKKIWRPNSKICMAKFRIWPPNSFGGPNQKPASQNKAEMRSRVDSENFMQKF